jgi:hypothetical protein
MFFGFGCGLRVGGRVGEPPALTFIPAHINAAGKKVSHRCEIPVYCNSNRGADGGDSSLFKLTVWNELARKCALTLSPGKAIDVLVELKSFKKKVYQNQQLVQGADGQPITVNMTGMTILRIVFGEESKKVIEGEIAASIRPAGWNNPASPDNAMWTNTLKQRLALQYTPQMGNQFGYARVFMPQGQLLPPEQASNAGQGDSVFAGTQPAASPVQQVQAAFTPQPQAGFGIPSVAPTAPAAVPQFGQAGYQANVPAATPQFTGAFGM